MSSFKEATKVQAVDSHTYSAVFPPEWCIGSVPHGGYVTACALAVLRMHFATTHAALHQPHTLTLHLSFLRRTSTGPATFTIQDAKLGRQTSNVHISLRQGNREEVVGYAIQSNLATETGLTLPTNWSLHPAPYPAITSKLQSNSDPHWELLATKPFSAFRKASAIIQFYLPRKGQLEKSMVDEWLRCSTGERFTMDSLGFVADTFLQIVEGYKEENKAVAAPSHRQWAKFWYPTLVLNLEVKKLLPPEGVEWLFLRVRTKSIKNGRMDLEVVILDEEGDLVALSQHIALILSADRNMAERAPKGEEGNPKL